MIQMYPPQNNSPQTALVDTINTTTTSVNVEDASVLPAAPNVLTFGLDENAELVLMTGKSGNALTVTRGWNGTTPRAWDGGTAVYRAITAQDIEALQENVREVDGKVVGVKQEAVSEAVAAAAADATSKANKAKDDAVSAAAADATTKANKAKSDAVAEANEYADDVAEDAKNAAISTAATDATSKANAAKAAAIETASGDATTKANNAQSNAVASAKTYTDTEIGKVNANVTANANAIATVKTSVENLTTEVSDKANTADVVPKTGTTMTGALTAYGGAYGTAQVRNVYFGTADLTAGSASTQPEGTMYFKYE